MMRLRTVFNAKTLIEILNWLARHARTNFRSVTSLAIQIAFEALLSDLIRIVTKWAIFDTIWGLPLFLLKYNHICHIVWCKGGTFGVTLTVSEERQVISANNAVLISDTIAELACLVASDVSDFDILVPFRSHMGKYTELILDASH